MKINNWLCTYDYDMQMKLGLPTRNPHENDFIHMTDLCKLLILDNMVSCGSPPTLHRQPWNDQSLKRYLKPLKKTKCKNKIFFFSALECSFSRAVERSRWRYQKRTERNLIKSVRQFHYHNYSIILLYQSSGDRDEYFDISEFRYNRSSFVLILCPTGLQIELRYKRNFDISEFDIAGLCCSNIVISSKFVIDIWFT